ncbi:MAG: flagellar basal-body rod protein FlgF [Proteobacteria bacterium]|nr:flagellar basal-body rod protein FlgF [Pseudomonadota bacterium]
MVSGKYSALSGALTREQAMNNISSNLANISTTGFKKDRISFASLLHGAQQTRATKGINYARTRTIDTDFSQGGMQTTGRPLDVAIDGPGFLKVRKGNEFFYTRAGQLTLDATGTLMTNDGYTVLGADNGPIQLDTSQGKDIVIADTGAISVNGEASSGALQVFTVPEPDKLTKVSQSLYKLSQGGDQPATGTRVVQGNLETANVNMVEEMTAMIASQRAFEAHTKVLETYSKISEKQDELGSIS